MRARKWGGFTLVELLVVIAIIGMLVAIIMPAVQAARESGRRAQCVNNIKQLALACQSYENNFQRLPVSNSPLPADAPTLDVDLFTGKGWLVDVLPFIEQQPLYNVIANNKGLEGKFVLGDPGGGIGRVGAVREALATPVNSLICPSDSASTATNQDGFDGMLVGLTNYKGVMGPNEMGTSTVHTAIPDFAGATLNCESVSENNCKGAFWRGTFRKPIRMVDFRDGTSNTLLLGEDTWEVKNSNQHNESVAFFSDHDYASTFYKLNYLPTEGEAPEDNELRGFRSSHPGVVNFAAADGSVRPLADSIEHKLYAALSTRADWEIAQFPN